MKSKQTIKHNKPATSSHEAAQARAALEALFGDAQPAVNTDPKLPDGDALVARKAAEAKVVSSKIDLLRRKREALDEILREAQRHGLTIDDLRST
ncbi:hypothetical protein KSF73_07655 [Burkholderiaceae bacterium DAT-1]|nr:hypothetical protein [Burkholderiaceae bacterium DAT-1]